MNDASDQLAIRTILEAVNRAYHDRDATSVAAHFAPDALIADLAPPLSHAFDRAGLATWLASWEGPVERESRDLAITVGGDLAFAHELVHVSAVTKEGGQLAAWWMRATTCLRREHGTWTIVHEHTSVPFHMDGSFRAAVDLAPSSTVER